MIVLLLGASADGQVVAFVPGLGRHLAACDLALVQSGLTTCMELTAAGTPFIYFRYATISSKTSTLLIVWIDIRPGIAWSLRTPAPKRFRKRWSRLSVSLYDLNRWKPMEPNAQRA